MASEAKAQKAFLTQTEAGAQAGLCAARISQLAIRGEIPSRRYGRRRLIERAGFESWLEERREVLGQ